MLLKAMRGNVILGVVMRIRWPLFKRILRLVSATTYSLATVKYRVAVKKSVSVAT